MIFAKYDNEINNCKNGKWFPPIVVDIKSGTVSKSLHYEKITFTNFIIFYIGSAISGEICS